MRCDARPRDADSALCGGCQEDVRQGRPLPAPDEGTVELRYDVGKPTERVVARIVNVRLPVGWFFCSPGNRPVPDVATGPLCDRCRAQLRGLREYLRTVCSTLEPLGPE
jgi:hypothetical protein